MTLAPRTSYPSLALRKKFKALEKCEGFLNYHLKLPYSHQSKSGWTHKCCLQLSPWTWWKLVSWLPHWPRGRCSAAKQVYLLSRAQASRATPLSRLLAICFIWPWPLSVGWPNLANKNAGYIFKLPTNNKYLFHVSMSQLYSLFIWNSHLTGYLAFYLAIFDFAYFILCCGFLTTPSLPPPPLPPSLSLTHTHMHKHTHTHAHRHAHFLNPSRAMDRVRYS